MIETEQATAGSRIPYSRDELYRVGGQREFSGRSLGQIAFPLGGIGTGTVALGGRGQLRDWEIFNRPSKGLNVPHATLLRVQAPDQPAVVRVLQGRLQPPYNDGVNGYDAHFMGGLPHMAECVFRGEYPLATLSLSDPSMPVRVALEAFTPFTPMNDHDSGLPVAVFLYTITNVGPAPLDVTLVQCLLNPVGIDAGGPLPVQRPDRFRRFSGFGGNLNEWVADAEVRGIRMSNPRIASGNSRFGTLALATPWPDTTFALHWQGDAWFDDLQTFWDGLAARPNLTGSAQARPSDDGSTDIGSLGLRVPVLAPGQSVRLPLVLAWHFPNLVNYWNETGGALGSSNPDVFGSRLGNYYTTLFADAFAAARYAATALPRLERETKEYHDVFFGSTLPAHVLDAASSQSSIIRTTTCLRTEDGEFHAFEGCNDTTGCCPLNCTHVWNYEQSLAFLFPALERSMRRTDFRVNVRPTGNMAFRTILPLGAGLWEFKPAADGQMGCLLKLYREWQIGGDLEFVRSLWTYATRALEYAWKNGWDPDKDGVMEGEQHNTYDIEFYGPNTMMGSLYLGALKAMAEMAEALGDQAKADEYRSIFEKGSARYDRELWNGEYYIQKYDPVEAPPYQYGEGCLIDQLLGQWFADVVGLGDLFPADHVRQTLASIFRYNFRANFADHACCQRGYVFNDEAGLLIHTWPHGDRPALPLVRGDEVWSGCEYQAAAHMLYRGVLDEGLAVVKAVRDRYDGERRNPWNEVECGNHYARAMASWSLLLALTGYHYSAPRQSLRLAPLVNAENFQSFFSAGESWGRFSQRLDRGALHWQLEIVGGRPLTLQTLRLHAEDAAQGAQAHVSVAGSSRAARTSWDGHEITVDLDAPATVAQGQVLSVKI